MALKRVMLPPIMSSLTRIEKMVECPICLEVNSKLRNLPCGHFLCDKCMKKSIDRQGPDSPMKCPMCRDQSTVPQGGFSVVLALGDVVSEINRQRQSRSHECMECCRPKALEDMILCHTCDDKRLCVRCIIPEHNGHDMQKLEEYIRKCNEFEEWKDEKLQLLESQRFKESSNDLEGLLEKIITCKDIIEQNRAAQHKLTARRNDFEDLLQKGMVSKIDLQSLENEFEKLEQEHKQVSTQGQELCDTLRVLNDLDLSKLRPQTTGILLINNGIVHLFSPPNPNLTQLHIKSMENRHQHVTCALDDHKVMIAGGKNGRGVTALTEIIDLATQQPVPKVGSMINARINAASAVIDGQMFVTGGQNEKNHILNYCEVYRNGKWEAIADMQEHRMGHSVVALGAQLLAIGGWNLTGGDLDTVEQYSPDSDTWQRVASLKHKRRPLAAAVLDGVVYAAGGKNGWDYLTVCEKYNQKEDKWERVADMNKGRRSFSLVAFGGKLFALGGDKEESVESYDPEMNQWRMENVCLKTSCLSAAVCTFPSL